MLYSATETSYMLSTLIIVTSAFKICPGESKIPITSEHSLSLLSHDSSGLSWNILTLRMLLPSGQGQNILFYTELQKFSVYNSGCSLPGPQQFHISHVPLAVSKDSSDHHCNSLEVFFYTDPLCSENNAEISKHLRSSNYYY